MNQIVFVFLAAVAMLNMHVARGDDCKATIDGKEVSLKNGDRYCADETTSKTCSDGQFTEDKCPPGSKCLKSPDSHATLCRELRRNVPGSAPETPDQTPNQPKQSEQPKQESASKGQEKQSDNGPAAAAPTAGKPETCQANIEGKDQTLNTGDRYCVDSVNHRVCSYGEWVEDKCPAGSNCLKAPDSWKVLCREIRRNPPQPDHPSARARRSANQTEPAPVAAPEKPETCQANIEGKDQTVNTGDRYCVDQNTHRVCNYGEWIDDKCPAGSTCLKSPTSFQVLCREVRKNAAQPEHPTQNSEPQSNSNSAPAPAPAPVPAPAPAPVPAPAPAPQPTGNEAPAQPKPDQGGKTCAGGLKDGENVCTSETTYKQCNNGALVEDSCPTNSKCLKSETSNAVLCREIRLNSKQNPRRK